EAVLNERAGELRRCRRQRQREEGEGQRPGGGEPAHPASVVATREERRDEHQQHERSDSDLEREGDHGATIRASSGTVAVSTGPRARPGTRPNRTITPTRITSATHSGPRAAPRWSKGDDGGPQKICLITRRTWLAVRNIPATS